MSTEKMMPVTRIESFLLESVSLKEIEIERHMERYAMLIDFMMPFHTMSSFTFFSFFMIISYLDFRTLARMNSRISTTKNITARRMNWLMLASMLVDFTPELYRFPSNYSSGFYFFMISVSTVSPGAKIPMRVSALSNSPSTTVLMYPINVSTLDGNKTL